MDSGECFLRYLLGILTSLLSQFTLILVSKKALALQDFLGTYLRSDTCKVASTQVESIFKNITDISLVEI